MKKEHLKPSPFPNGSEWRRWDLHIHTPESKLGSSFVGVNWPTYLDHLENAAKTNNISVIGITDYMSIDGYEILHPLRNDPNAPRLQTVDLLIPNIEFRALPSTREGKALNIHLLIDPTDTEHIQKIKRALKNLKFDYKFQKYGCIKDELIELGLAIEPSLRHTPEAAYKKGIEQFKPSYEQIFQWIEGEHWLKSNSLIGIANSKDGISGLPTDGFSAVRDELLRKCHFIFSGNPKDRAYYLGEKIGTSSDDIISMYSSLKPCLHGSDSHELSTLFKPDENRRCWIKADPTFEGLRQVLWEPKLRVHIGHDIPQPLDNSKILKSLQIKNSNGWFSQSSIPLNSGLVAVIGEKGAGKTAIADILSFSSGIALDQKSQSSFITKGRHLLHGVELELYWANGYKSTCTLPDKPHPVQRPLVRYLSQDFVERLCSGDHGGKELQRAIEEVIFSYLDDIQKESFSSFDELRSARESASQSARDAIRGQIAALHREIERLHTVIGQIPQKIAHKAEAEKQIEELKKQLPSATAAADKLVIEALERKYIEKQQLTKSISEKSRARRAINDLLTFYRTLKIKVGDEINSISSAIKNENLLSPELLVRMKPQWDELLETDLTATLNALDSEILSIQGNETSATASGATIVEINQRIRRLQEQLTNDETNKKRLVDLQKQIASQESTIQRLGKEIEDSEVKTKRLLEQKEKERFDLYTRYFDALASDEKGLQELYAPMKAQLAAIGEKMKFSISAGYKVATREWLDKAARFFDGRKPQALAKKEEIENFVTTTLAPAWHSGNKNEVAEAFNSFLTLISPKNFSLSLAPPSIKLIDIYDWLYSTDHIDISYKIEYGGTSLEKLSPGTRGIALLVLYLLMDEDDRRPLIIDQPEGNLDNSSIYEQLVPYIRQAKAKRQIVLITHNPNLVVATDADQIIIATCERNLTQGYPTISYISGALEHNYFEDDKFGTRHAVCTLLEGGHKAFKEREGRYSIGI